MALNLRIDRYLAARSAQTGHEHIQLWPELFGALNAWTNAPSDPSALADLRKLGVEGKAGAQRLL